LIISLTLYGLYIYFAKEDMMEFLTYMNEKTVTNTGNAKADAATKEFLKKVNNFSINYMNLITFISIPVFAVINLILFRKRNFIEHNIALVYAHAQYYIITALIGFLALFTSIPYQHVTTITLIFTIIYFMYFYKRLFELSFWKIILKTILFWLLLGVAYFILGIMAFIVGILFTKFFPSIFSFN